MWKIRLLFVLLVAMCSSCGEKVVEKTDLKRLFDAYQVDGCILIYDLNSDKYNVYNPHRTEQKFLPASTFKIANTLIALQTRVVIDTMQVFKWDGVERSVPDWNHDQTLKTAFRYSCVPVYQQIAREIGYDKMKHYLDAMQYGSFIFTEDNIDTFWLFGESRVTCYDQIALMKKIYTGQLPFDQDYIDLLKDIMVDEQTDEYTLRAKTGWAEQDNMQIGWYVGALETKKDTYLFALNIVKNEADQLFKSGRKNISKDIFKELSLID